MYKFNLQTALNRGFVRAVTLYEAYGEEEPIHMPVQMIKREGKTGTLRSDLVNLIKENPLMNPSDD